MSVEKKEKNSKKKFKSESEKFQAAMRFEIPFDEVNIDDLMKEDEKDHKAVLMGLNPRNLLCGLRKYNKLTGAKKKSAYILYIEKMAKIYDKEELKIDLEDDYGYDQYYAPNPGFYIDYIMQSILNKKFNIAEAIKILDTYVKNEKVPIEKKEIPDIGILDIFDRIDNGSVYYDDTEAGSDDAYNKRLVELADKAIKLGSKGALFEKACSFHYWNYKDDIDPEDIAKATVELITKHKDYSALCEFGFANEWIEPKKLFNYYKEGIKKGYNVDENVAYMLEKGIGTKPNIDLALKIRKRAYEKYKKQYLKDKKGFLNNSKYAYAAFNLGRGLLDYAFVKKIKPDIKWKKCFKEAKKLNCIFLEMVPLSYNDYHYRAQIERSHHQLIEMVLNYGEDAYYLMYYPSGVKKKDYIFTNELHAINNGCYN